MSLVSGDLPSQSAGRRVGRYELLVPIASGGMAWVYLARQQTARGFERLVALKQTHAHLREQSEWVSELIEEAKLASRVIHPNVVQVLDMDDDENGVFLVMQYVEGDTLSGLFRCGLKSERRLPLGISIRILADALSGLHAAHELRDEAGQRVGLVHRDFSPQNVLVGLDGISRLTDFGVAKAADRVGFTRTGTIKGKFGYMSPEQVRDEPLDARSDVFSAGVVAWELFAGQRMYSSGDQTSTLLRIATEPARRLRTVVPDIPPELDEAVASALTIKRQDRCPTAEAFRERLLAAYRAIDEVPNAREVGAFVRALSGDKLAERRAKCDEVIAARAQTSSLAPAKSQTIAAETAPDVSAGKEKRGFPGAIALTSAVVVGVMVVGTGLVVRTRLAKARASLDVAALTSSPAAPAIAALPPSTSPTAQALSSALVAVSIPPTSSPAAAASDLTAGGDPAHATSARSVVRARGTAPGTAAKNGAAGKGTSSLAPTSPAPSAAAAPSSGGLLRNPYEPEKP